MSSKEKELELLQGRDSLTPKAPSVPWFCTFRWTLAIIGFFGFVTAYALRINLSVAMVCMINQTALREMSALDQHLNVLNISSSATYDNFSDVIVASVDNDCSASSANRTIRDGEFAWPKKTQGFVLSSFFWGYLLIQLPGGWLAQRFGGRRVIGYFMALAVVSTLLSSVAARGHPYVLMLLRICNGLGQGVIFPATHQIFSKWAPPAERSKLLGFTMAGAQMGNVLALPIAAVLCDYGFDGGWSSIFYVFGIAGGVWVILWLVLVSDSPAVHPRITPEERQFIEASLGAQKSKQMNTPWGDIFRSPPVWAIIVAQTCCMWGTYMLLTSMPTYMSEVLKFDIKSNGALSALPYILFWALINVGGVVADHMRANGFRTKVVRKMMYTIGSVVPAIMLVATGYVSCKTPYIAVVVLIIAVGFSGFQFPGMFVNHADIAPPFAGVLFGIANTVATLSGIFAPYAVGLLTTNSTQEEWRIVFYLSAVIYLIGAAVFCLLADGEIQPWVRKYMRADSVDETHQELQPTLNKV